MHEGSLKKPRKCIKNDLGKDRIDQPLWRKNHAQWRRMSGKKIEKNIGGRQQRPKKGYINNQERLLWLENDYIDGLKKICKEDIMMKHGM